MDVQELLQQTTAAINEVVEVTVGKEKVGFRGNHDIVGAEKKSEGKSEERK